MNLFGLLPATNRRLYRSILLTLLLACLLIAATLWVYQRRIQRLQQKLNESSAPAISFRESTRCHPADQQFSFLSFPTP